MRLLLDLRGASDESKALAVREWRLGTTAMRLDRALRWVWCQAAASRVCVRCVTAQCLWGTMLQLILCNRHLNVLISGVPANPLQLLRKRQGKGSIG